MMKSLHIFAAILLAGLTAHAQTPAPNAPPPDPYVLLAGFDFGQDRAPLNQIDALIKAADDAARRAEIEGKLADLLSQPSLPIGAQNYICVTLSVIGGEKSVPALAGLLGDERKADLARLALERIPHASAGSALRTALPKSAGRTRIGLAQSLGVRRDEAAVPLLAPLLKDADPATAAAAAHALGQIANAAALKALRASGRLAQPAVADAVLACADARAGDSAREAAGIYRDVLDVKGAPAIQEAALVGLARVAPDEAARRLVALFDSGDEAAVARAIRLARRVQVPAFARSAADRLPKLPAGAQIAVLALLGDLGQAEARPAVLARLQSDDEAVRLAAVEALGALPGDATVVARLAALAGAGAPAEKKAAARSLVRVPGPEADKALRAGAHAGSVPERLACIAALGERQAAGTDQFLLGLRSEGDAEIRRGALRALDKVAGPEWHGPTLAWLLAATDEAEAREAERLVIRLGEKAPTAVDELLAADAQATDTGRERLARCLARRGGDAALQKVRAYAASENATLAAAAVRALGGWKDAAPLPDLLAVVEKGGEPRRIALAVQGALQLLATDAARPAAAKAEVVGQLLAQTQQPEARKLLISALGEYPSDTSRDLAAGLVNDPQCGAEAKAALRRIRQAALPPPALTASHNAGELKHATDKNPGTRWTTSTGMAPGQWLELDLHATCLIRRIVLDTAGSAGDYPRTYQVFVGDAPAPAGAPALTGEGKGPVTEIVLDPPRRGRHVRIVQQGTVGNLFWSVHELTVEAELLDETAP